jgi:glycerol-3-phosphate dehydrogenase
VGEVLGSVVRANTPASVRLVQGSHIVVPRLYAHDRCYIFQNGDGRIFFAIPYEGAFTLIGTTDQDFTGDPGAVRASAAEIAYLCQGASDYFRTPVTQDMVVWTYSGVRPLYDDGASQAQSATRDYVLKLDAPAGQAALLNIFGGKITTYRRLAESALAELAPHLPAPTGLAAGWTGQAPLPGGDFPAQGFARRLDQAVARYPFLPRPMLHRLLRAYGSRIDVLLEGVRGRDDLGRMLGADLSEAELRYLVRHEWVRTAEDAVWRRTKLGLKLTREQIAEVERLLGALTGAEAVA